MALSIVQFHNKRSSYLSPGFKIQWHILGINELTWTWGCFTNVSCAPQNIILKFEYCRSCTSYGDFKPKLSVCAQSHTFGRHKKFQLATLTINVISCIVYFREINLESSWNINENKPQALLYHGQFSTWKIAEDSKMNIPVDYWCLRQHYLLHVTLLSWKNMYTKWKIIKEIM